MKTYKNLYPQIYIFENLYTAYRKARKGKRSRVEVAAFEFDMERNLLQLQSELHDQTYRPGHYHNFYIYEPKLRLVSAAPFRDRVGSWYYGPYVVRGAYRYRAPPRRHVQLQEFPLRQGF